MSKKKQVSLQELKSCNSLLDRFDEETSMERRIEILNEINHKVTGKRVSLPLSLEEFDKFMEGNEPLVL